MDFSKLNSKDRLDKKIGTRVMINAYKFNGWLYRVWEYPLVLEVNDDYIVLASHESDILTSKLNSKQFFYSKVSKPTFWFLFKDKWFNLIVTITPKGCQSYINVSSPFIFEESAFKYIDFDLDFKIFPNHTWIEVDINEFMVNQVHFKYPPILIKKIKETEDELIKLIKDNYFLQFSSEQNINKYQELFKKMTIKEKKKNEQY